MIRNILVTGGAGYIGSHTCKALHAAGYLPVTYDDLSLGNPEAVRWGPMVQGDIRNTDLLAAVIREYQVDGVIHFAAHSIVSQSVTDPAIYYDVNVGGLLSLLKAINLQDTTPSLVFSSTAAVYGSHTEKIVESATKSPLNPYGHSKLICEQVIDEYRRAYGIRATSLRYFNASGADPQGEIGERRRVETHLIPRALMSIQGHVDDFQVFGADFPTPDGTAIRDYVHVCDLAEAHILAIRALSEGGAGSSFNVGTGHGISVAEIMREIERVTGRGMNFPTGARRDGDPAMLIADASLARIQLGFRPKLSDLSTIIETAWAWHQKAHPAKQIDACKPQKEL